MKKGFKISDIGEQETLEEFAERWNEKQTTLEFGKPHNAPNRIRAFIEGAKWQQEQDKLDEDNIRLDERCKCELENITTFSEGYDAGISQQERSYSEEEVLKILEKFENDEPFVINEWFEQFKKTENSYGDI